MPVVEHDLFLLGVRDHTPCTPPIAWSLRFVQVGRSCYPAQQGVNVLVSGEFD